MKSFKVFAVVLAVYSVVAGWFLLTGCNKKESVSAAPAFEDIERDLAAGYRGIVYDSSALTAEDFEFCANNNRRVIERCISVVKNDAFDGAVFNTSDVEYNYISFNGLDVMPGDIVVTYLVFELGAECDEIQARYDYRFLTGEKIQYKRQSVGFGG